MTTQKCQKCQKCKQVKTIEDFGCKKNGEFYKMCVQCREKENKSHPRTKKSFLDDYPELGKEWDYEKNSKAGIHPENFSYGSNKKVWWKCAKSGCHVWEALISNRTGVNKNGCPICSNQKVCPCSCNSLYESNPELEKEWDEKKNGSMKTY
jgi:hypothetical protein